MRVNQVGVTRPETTENSRTEKTSRSKKASYSQTDNKTSEAGESDAVNTEISTKGKEFAKAKAVAESAPEIREAKIAELRRRIAAGEYNVKSRDIADKLVDEHLSTA